MVGTVFQYNCRIITRFPLVLELPTNTKWLLILFVCHCYYDPSTGLVPCQFSHVLLTGCQKRSWTPYFACHCLSPKWWRSFPGSTCGHTISAMLSPFCVWPPLFYLAGIPTSLIFCGMMLYAAGFALFTRGKNNVPSQVLNSRAVCFLFGF